MRHSATEVPSISSTLPWAVSHRPYRLSSRGGGNFIAIGIDLDELIPAGHADRTFIRGFRPIMDMFADFALPSSHRNPPFT
jgi:hypothetical protein